MIYIDLNMEPIDQGEDLWWFFHLKEVCDLKTYRDLLRALSLYGIKLAGEHLNDANDPDIFQAVLDDEEHSIRFTVFNSSDASNFFLGMSAEHVIPPLSPEARLNADLFLEYGKICYQILQPIYAFAENLNIYVKREDLEAHRLTHMCWAQLLGPDFVRGVGQGILINAPAWRNENMGDEGLLYVLAASPYLYRGPRQYWEAARQYFKGHISDSIVWSDMP